MTGTQSMDKTLKKAIRRRDVARLVAEIHGVTPRYVRMVINCERDNDAIVETYMEIVEQDNALLDAVRKAVPF